MDREFMNAARGINSRLRRLEADHRRVALAAFPVLEKFDPETAKLALETFEDRDKAALWLSDHVGSLRGKTPWECLAAGDVGQVQWVLNAIIYGIPP